MMPLRDPKDIRSDLHLIMETLQKAAEPLRPIEQKQMATKLVPVFNYVSENVEQRSGINILWAQSARDAELKKLLAAERQALEQHKSFVEVSFDSAEKHFKTVQLAGYAVFFTSWAFTRDWVPAFIEAASALLMMLSAAIFVLWELGKASVLAAILRKHAKISSHGLNEFLTGRSKDFGNRSLAILFFSRARVWVLWVCVPPAIIAVGLMIISIVRHLIAVATH